MDQRIIHNANHPIEKQVVNEMARILENHEWPFDRILVNVVFGLRSGYPSQCKINGGIREGQLHGEARVFFNYLYLMQKPSEFISEIIPHEAAHLFVKAHGISADNQYKEHGPEWKEKLYTISTEATPAAKGPGDIFDDRPIKLLKGGTPTVCGCEDPYFIVGTMSEGKIGDLYCKQCDMVYRKISRDELPENTINQYEYIIDEQTKRGAKSIPWS